MFIENVKAKKYENEKLWIVLSTEQEWLGNMLICTSMTNFSTMIRGHFYTNKACEFGFNKKVSL